MYQEILKDLIEGINENRCKINQEWGEFKVCFINIPATKDLPCSKEIRILKGDLLLYRSCFFYTKGNEHEYRNAFEGLSKFIIKEVFIGGLAHSISILKKYRPEL